MVTGKSHKPTKFTRLVLYPLGAVIFFCVLFVVLVLANGFKFTFDSGKIGLTKTGMIILSTRPYDASIKIDGEDSNKKTSFHLLPTKLTGLKPGKYYIEVSKKGYRTWKNTLEVKPNMVTWANYLLLFAEKLNVAKLDAPSGKVLASSENGRHVLFTSATELFKLESFDVGNSDIRNFWPQTLPVEPWLVSPQITSATYNYSNDKVLLKITNGARTEYVVADASANQTRLIHLNVSLKDDFEDAWWNISNSSEVYLKTKNGISLVSVYGTELPPSLLASAISFKVDESRQIFYVTTSLTGIYTISRMDLNGNNKTVLVESILPSKTYKLGYSDQNNTLTVLNDAGELSAYYIGNANKKYSIKLCSDVSSYGWSKNGEFIYYYGKNFIKKYEWDKSKETVVALDKVPKNVEWYFDDNHFLVSNSTGVYVMDSDGTNAVPLSEAEASYYSLDKTNNNVFFAAKDSSGLEAYHKYISEF